MLTVSGRGWEGLSEEAEELRFHGEWHTQARRPSHRACGGNCKWSGCLQTGAHTGAWQETRLEVGRLGYLAK